MIHDPRRKPEFARTPLRIEHPEIQLQAYEQEKATRLQNRPDADTSDIDREIERLGGMPGAGVTPAAPVWQINNGGNDNKLASTLRAYEEEIKRYPHNEKAIRQAMADVTANARKEARLASLRSQLNVLDQDSPRAIEIRDEIDRIQHGEPVEVERAVAKPGRLRKAVNNTDEG